MGGSLIEAALLAVLAGMCENCGVQGIRGKPVWPALVDTFAKQLRSWYGPRHQLGDFGRKALIHA
jgi:hypothetical protein